MGLEGRKVVFVEGQSIVDRIMVIEHTAGPGQAGGKDQDAERGEGKGPDARSSSGVSQPPNEGWGPSADHFLSAFSGRSGLILGVLSGLVVDAIHDAVLKIGDE